MREHGDTGLLRHLALPAEVLLIGVLVCAASLPVVTSLAATGAGAVLLRELVEAERTPTVRRFLTLLATSLRQPPALLAPLLAAAVAVLDALALSAGLPGGAVLGPVVAAALALLLLTGTRASALWRPNRAWRQVLAEAAATMPRDWQGSLMLAGALLVTALVALQVPAFALITPGLLVMAALAVEQRRTA
jgi:hypothetical protein